MELARQSTEVITFCDLSRKKIPVLRREAHLVDLAQHCKVSMKDRLVQSRDSSDCMDQGRKLLKIACEFYEKKIEKVGISCMKAPAQLSELLERRLHQEETCERYLQRRCDGMIGPDESDDSHLTILNRIVSPDKSTGVASYEADPRHAEMIIKQLQLESAKPVRTHAEKKKLAGVISSAGLPQIDAEKTTLYR